MIINALNIFANFLIRVLKGIIGFMEEMMPLLLKNAFVLSPFLLTIFVAKKIGGSNTAIWAAAISIIFIVIGIIWTFRKNITDSSLTPELFISILLIDSLLIGLVFVPNNTIAQWMERSHISTVVLLSDIKLLDKKEITGKTAIDGKSVNNHFYELKETEFLKLLETSIANGNLSDIIRATDELREMKSIKHKNLVIQALSKYYSNASSSHKNNYWYICTSCLNALVVLNSTDVCKLLFEIQAKRPEIYDITAEAASKICK